MTTTQDHFKTLMTGGKGKEVKQLLDTHGQRAAARFRQVREDNTLSEEGKRQQLAAAAVSARKAVDQEVATMASRVYVHDRDDATTVFGIKGLDGDPASLSISRRDAGDRVAKVESRKDLQDLLRRATRSGDEVLARAVAEYALEQHDAKTLNQFIADRPHLDAPIQRLWDAEQASSDVFALTIMLSEFTPTELRGVASSTIEQLAQPS